MDIGSAGIMREFMADPCDEELTLEKKLRLFLTMCSPQDLQKLRSDDR